MSEINKELRDYLETYYRPLRDLEFRIHNENKGLRERNPTQRDYSRVLYSPSFRRLQGKMQLLSVHSDKFYRNRLTHSLEVSQIARAIAEKLRRDSNLEDIYQDDMYVIETGALAHDIGNPPFGHHGERVLNDLMEEGGFEGNAQTVRVLHEVEKKLQKERGLNLTLRTLLSVVKYYVPYNSSDLKLKKFIYENNYKQLQQSLSEFKVEPRTVDVQIVDLADEIAYAAHDLEDALSLKLFNIDEFVFEFKNEKRENDIAYEKLQELVLQAKTYADLASNYNSSEEYGFLFRKELTSNLVNVLIQDIGLINVSEKFKKKTGTRLVKEIGFMTLGELANGVKEKTFECINRSNTVQLYEKQGEKVIKGLFTVFNDKAFNKDNLLLPAEYRNFEKVGESRERAVSDYISGMMDSYAVKIYKDYYGDNEVKKIFEEK